jgi:hypothetical protein
MNRIARYLLCLVLVLGSIQTGKAFSLLGPFKSGATGTNAGVTDPWQGLTYGTAAGNGLPQGLGYTLLFDIGGPMFLTEAYRWNVPTITYAFDESFIRYFGTNGMFAIDKAFKILNSLPPCSQMSPDLSEFPAEETREVNNTAQALGITDIKSYALVTLMEELGLANAQRFVWGLRSRLIIAGVTNYSVLPMNYDPVTYRWSPYVNGVLFAYRIVDPITNALGQSWASAVEIAMGDPAFVDKRTPVAARRGHQDLFYDDQGLNLLAPIDTMLLQGHSLTGLTRDDVGGLRFLLLTNNVVTEVLLTNVVAETTLPPWTPINGTNAVGTNTTGGTNVVGGTNLLGTNFLRQALRGGLDKLTFQRVNYDSLIGLGFVTITNKYRDNIITNGRPGFQKVQRVIVEPDILFLSEDIGLIQGVPASSTRTGTAGWLNNNAVNGRANQQGPGVIPPPIRITFTDNAPYFVKFLESPFGNHLDVPFVWGSFDASTNTPIIYPEYLHYTVQDIADQVLGVGEGPPFP